MSTDPAALARRFGSGGGQHAPVVDSSGRSLGPGWRTSSYSTQDRACVRIARDPDGAILLADSRTPQGPVVRVTGTAWCAFLRAVHDGEMD
ncbi:DUF397 domain-containing protein [Halostreptopolyspora alba]